MIKNKQLGLNTCCKMLNTDLMQQPMQHDQKMLRYKSPNSVANLPPLVYRQKYTLKISYDFFSLMKKSLAVIRTLKWFKATF